MRASIRFDSMNTSDLRTVCAAYAQAKLHPEFPTYYRDGHDGVVVGCDGPESFNATVPPLPPGPLATFLARADRVLGINSLVDRSIKEKNDARN